jgi:hypothetical protein
MGRAIDDEDRPPAPAHEQLLPRLQMAEVDVDRPAEGENRRVRVHLADQWYGRGERAECSDGGGRDVKKVAARRLRRFLRCNRRHDRHGTSSSERRLELIYSFHAMLEDIRDIRSLISL